MEELNAAGDPVDNANEDDGNDIGILVVVFSVGTYYIQASALVTGVCTGCASAGRSLQDCGPGGIDFNHRRVCDGKELSHCRRH